MQNYNMEAISNQNVINSIKWKNLDILITTPPQLELIIEAKRSLSPKSVNPLFLVLDEFDLLITDDNHKKAIKYLLRHFGGKFRTPFTQEENNRRQFILCGATMLKIYKGIEFKEMLGDWFENIDFIETPNFLKVNPNIEFQDLNVQDLDFEEKCEVLLEFYYNLNKNNQILVFCNATADLYDIQGFLSGKGVDSVILASKMTLNERVSSISRFRRGEVQICLCTDLISRGIDFPNVGTVIQFTFAKNAITYLHRVGRTGRLGRKGLVINFVD